MFEQYIIVSDRTLCQPNYHGCICGIDLTLMFTSCIYIDVANYLRLPYSSASNGTDYFNASFVNVSDISITAINENESLNIYLQYNAICTNSVNVYNSISCYIILILNYLLQSYSGRRAFITAQSPMAQTRNDIWKLIWQFRVSTIVLLCELREENQVILLLKHSAGRVQASQLAMDGSTSLKRA